MDLKKLTDAVIECCKRVDKEVISPMLREDDITAKSKDQSGRNFVTTVDLACEKALEFELSRILPQAEILSEELNPERAGGQALHWIVDPIDGTTNLMHRLPPYCISIALADKEETLLGVVYEICSKDTYYAWKSGEAWKNDQLIKTSKVRNFSESIIGTGFPYGHTNIKALDEWLSVLRAILQQTQGVRRIGAAAMDLVYVAEGRLDGFYEYNLEPWDVAAGALILQEAGGHISNFDGENSYQSGSQVVASNGLIHENLCKLIQENFDYTSFPV